MATPGRLIAYGLAASARRITCCWTSMLQYRPCSGRLLIIGKEARPIADQLTLDAPAGDWLRLKQEIKAAAPGMGIDKIGFASADPFLTLKDRLVKRRERSFECGFEEKDIDKRTHPELLFDGPRSILAIAVAYPSKLSDPPRSAPGVTRGIMARSAWGDDYHTVLRDRLRKLEAFIRERVPEARMESMVDTGALVDREVAVRAGIGFSGKNGSVITPEFGSYVYLGEMISNLPFEPDVPVTEGCGDCTLCLDACPTSAFAAPFVLDANRCISFLTQSKEEIPDELKEKMGNRLYGCDTCQVVCPKNKGMNWTHHEEFKPDPETVKPLLAPLLTIGNREFKERFGSGAAAWRGKKPIQRNAIIGLGKFRDKEAVPLLERVLAEDPRPDIRSTAAWALGQIGGEEAAEALSAASLGDPEGAVRVKAAEVLAAVREKVMRSSQADDTIV
ncbi:tRNA epoxyqueuosine(34) reductase QueG [Gorillibacterium timonense]|uniref:tRNA epoxyqueuosine(34) reductase QueG n=1 Tax=Gorillibacterium timonense TaxID=1689269 RepID=UPI001F2730E4|nr:tRNA epoxyqueuosine(34) reductase QueG [Gorillibacterium timonense]